MKEWILNNLAGLGAAALLPLAWKFAPKLIGKFSGKADAAWEAFLRKTHPYWKGHAKQLIDYIEKISEEAKSDINKIENEP